MRRVRVRAARRRRRAPGDHATASQCSIREVYAKPAGADSRNGLLCIDRAPRPHETAPVRVLVHAEKSAAQSRCPHPAASPIYSYADPVRPP